MASTLIGEYKFSTTMVLETSMSPKPEVLGKGDCSMKLYDNGDNTGNIEWYYEINGEGDEVSIGLWFEDGTKTLCDYDGVFELPKEAIELLEKHGYNADYAV